VVFRGKEGEKGILVGDGESEKEARWKLIDCSE